MSRKQAARIRSVSLVLPASLVDVGPVLTEAPGEGILCAQGADAVGTWSNRAFSWSVFPLSLVLKAPEIGKC